MPRKYQPKYLPDGSLNPRYKYRKRPSGSRSKTKFERTEFIAYDGEGADVSGCHQYLMLLNSQGEGVQSEQGLTTLDCLSFLVECGTRNPHATHVMFGMGYDVNMIVRDFRKSQVRALWNGERVPYKNRFLVSYQARRTLRIDALPLEFERNKNGVIRRKKSRSITIWDVFGFFQKSFVEALLTYLPDYPDTADIYAHKVRRSSFSVSEFNDIRDYCLKECRALAALMDRLRSYMLEARLQVTRWDGAGAVAAALLKRQGIKKYMSRAALLTPPKAVETAVRHAYAGGRNEVIRFGHAPNTTVYHYDINSAYPAAMRDVPCLACGRWERIGLPPIPTHDFSLYYVRWDFHKHRTRHMIYPLFWRAADRSVWFPPAGEGWYWGPEVKAAWEVWQTGLFGRRATFEILEQWRYVTHCDHRPFGWLEPLYEQRKQWKKEGIGAEKVIKLAINSLYGKTVQHVGWDSDVKRPPYHQLEWGGYITSATRAALYRAAMQSPESVIMLATDAVYSLKPLALPIGDRLGQWSFTQHCGITVVMSGVYWTDMSGNVEHFFCRGFDKGSLDRQSIIRAWNRGEAQYPATLTRFIGMGSALAGGTMWRKWRQWCTMRRMLDLRMSDTKRMPINARKNPAKGLVATQARTSPHFFVTSPVSAPYPLPWESDYGVAEDGVPVTIVNQEFLDSGI